METLIIFAIYFSVMAIFFNYLAKNYKDCAHKAFIWPITLPIFILLLIVKYFSDEA